MRFLILPFFIVSLLASIVALSVDVYIALIKNVWKFQLLGNLIADLGLRPELSLLQASIERYLWPDLWWIIIEPSLHQPASLVTSLLTLFFGIWFYWAHRRNQQRQVELISSIY